MKLIDDVVSRPPCTAIEATLIKSVRLVGLAAKGISSRSSTIKAGEGHRSIITEADVFSSEQLFHALTDFPNVRILCEEESSDKRAISQKDPVGIFDGEVVILDPLDGTSVYARHDPEWCIGAALFRDGIDATSVITAPQANGGTTLFSFDGVTYFVEGSGEAQVVGTLAEKPPKDCTILRGVDTELYANILSIMPKIAASVRAVDIKGSGHYGLMSVALGRADAIIQTPQKPWDWAPAYHAIDRAGGVFQFFRLKDGFLIPVDSYDKRAFKAGKENRLGFVAGEPILVDKLFSLLPKTGWERHDPDTI